MKPTVIRFKASDTHIVVVVTTGVDSIVQGYVKGEDGTTGMVMESVFSTESKAIDCFNSTNLQD